MGAEALSESAKGVSPGLMLKTARESLELSQRETADTLNWMPDYVAIIEADDYASLRSPSFARGYLKAFGRLVELDEDVLMRAFDSLQDRGDTVLAEPEKRPATVVQRQKTGLGVMVGLGSLTLLIAALWWWQGNPR